MYPRLPRFAYFVIGILVLLASIIALSLERANRLLLDQQLGVTLVAFALPVSLVVILSLLASHYYGLNRWIVLPISLILTAILLAILLSLSHLEMLPLISF